MVWLVSSCKKIFMQLSWCFLSLFFFFFLVFIIYYFIHVQQSLWKICGDPIRQEWEDIRSCCPYLFAREVSCLPNFRPWKKLSLFLPALCSTSRGNHDSFHIATCFRCIMYECGAKPWNYYDKIIYLPFQDREKYKLGNPKDFHYLNQSTCYKLDGIDDGEEYLATRRAMDVVGISEEEQVRFVCSCEILCS